MRFGKMGFLINKVVFATNSPDYITALNVRWINASRGLLLAGGRRLYVRLNPRWGDQEVADFAARRAGQLAETNPKIVTLERASRMQKIIRPCRDAERAGQVGRRGVGHHAVQDNG